MNIRPHNQQSDNWDLTEYNIALKALIGIFEAQSKNVDVWEHWLIQNAPQQLHDNWRMDYYSLQISQLARVLQSYRFFNNSRLEIAKFLRSHRLKLQLQNVFVPQLSLLSKMRSILKQLPRTHQVLIALREISPSERHAIDKQLYQMFPHDVVYVCRHSQNLNRQQKPDESLKILDLSIHQLIHQRQSNSNDLSALYFQKANTCFAFGRCPSSTSLYHLSANEGNTNIDIPKSQFDCLWKSKIFHEKAWLSQIYIHQYPNTHEFEFQLILIYLKGDRFAKGEKMLEQITKGISYKELQQRYLFLHSYCRGILNFYQLNFEASFFDFSTALKDKRATRQLYELMGHCCFSMEKYSLALYYLQMARQSPLGECSTIIDLKIAICFLSLGQLAKARQVISKFSGQLQSMSSPALGLAMKCYSKLSMPEKVFQCYNVLIERSIPIETIHICSLILNYKRFKTRLQAQKLFRKIVRDYHYPQSHHYQARVSYLSFLIRFAFDNSLMSQGRELMRLFDAAIDEIKEFNPTKAAQLRSGQFDKQPIDIELMLS